MIETLILAASGVTIVGGYLKTRGFVRRRLRYVDDVQKGSAPWIAGTVATLAAAPVAAVVPFIGAGVAVAFGVAVGAGTRAGARDIREGVPSSTD